MRLRTQPPPCWRWTPFRQCASAANRRWQAMRGMAAACAPLYALIYTPCPWPQAAWGCIGPAWCGSGAICPRLWPKRGGCCALAACWRWLPLAPVRWASWRRLLPQWIPIATCCPLKRKRACARLWPPQALRMCACSASRSRRITPACVLCCRLSKTWAPTAWGRMRAPRRWAVQAGRAWSKPTSACAPRRACP